MRLVAADGGPGAPHGKIVGLAASPDGLTLAVAEAEPGRIEIVVRYVISNGGQNSVASFDGNFHAVSLTWLAPDTLAVGLAGESAAPPAQPGGLYLIHVLGAVTVEQVKLDCPPSMLVFSPDARFAVGEGDEHTPASVFDSRNGNCHQVSLDGPIRVLGWAPGSAAFLYSTAAGRGHGAGVFRYNIADGKTDLIAVSSSAAAYTGEGVVMALGNRELNPADRGGVARQASDRANRELRSQAGPDDRRYPGNSHDAGDDDGEHDDLLARFRRAGAAIVRGRGGRSDA